MATQPSTFPATGPIGRLAAVMCFVVAIGAALAEISLAWFWLEPSWIEAYVLPRLGLSGVPVVLDWPQRLTGFAISMIPMSVLLYMLHQAFELFDGYRLGRLFTADAPVRLRRIGSAMIVLGVLRPFAGAALVVALTASNPPGQRLLSIGISIDDYMIALFGGLVLAIGQVMVEANRLADENRQIV